MVCGAGAAQGGCWVPLLSLADLSSIILVQEENWTILHVSGRCDPRKVIWLQSLRWWTPSTLQILRWRRKIWIKLGSFLFFPSLSHFSPFFLTLQLEGSSSYLPPLPPPSPVLSSVCEDNPRSGSGLCASHSLNCEGGLQIYQFPGGLFLMGDIFAFWKRRNIQ